MAQDVAQTLDLSGFLVSHDDVLVSTSEDPACPPAKPADLDREVAIQELAEARQLSR